MPEVTETPEAPEAGSGLISDGSHLDEQIREDEAAEDQEAALKAEADGTGDALKADTLTADGLFTFDAFKDGLGKGLFISGHMTGLQTLILSPEQASYPGAAAAIYDTLKETPALHFLLKPGGKWMQRTFAIGAFVVPVGMGCIAEVRARKAEPEKVERPPDDDEGYLRGHGYSDEEIAAMGVEVAQEVPPVGAQDQQPETVNESMVAA